jgi:hypothetical protein
VKIFQTVCQKGNFLFGMIYLGHFEKEVLPVKPGDELPRRAEPQLLNNVFPYPLGCGRGQSDNLGPAQRVQRLADPEVVRTEVMAPFGDAMGFIHGHQGDRLLFESVQKRGVPQAFRGDINHPVRPGRKFAQNLLLLREAHEAVDGDRGKVQDAQGIHLVFHEGDKGRDDQAGAGKDQGRELVTDGLSRPGGHDRQDILAGKNRLDNFLLPGPELMKPKDPFHELAGLEELVIYVRREVWQFRKSLIYIRQDAEDPPKSVAPAKAGAQSFRSFLGTRTGRTSYYESISLALSPPAS